MNSFRKINNVLSTKPKSASKDSGSNSSQSKASTQPSGASGSAYSEPIAAANGVHESTSDRQIKLQAPLPPLPSSSRDAKEDRADQDTRLAVPPSGETSKTPALTYPAKNAPHIPEAMKSQRDLSRSPEPRSSQNPTSKETAGSSAEDIPPKQIAEMLRKAYPQSPKFADSVERLGKDYNKSKKYVVKLRDDLNTEKEKVNELSIKLAQRNIKMSSCILDDAQYMQLFQSMDASVESISSRLKRAGAWNVSKLADGLPASLRPQDIGRGIIAAWIASVFSTYMHPAIDLETSKWLKSEVERKIKQTSSPEDVVKWRCMTVEALLPSELLANQESRGALESTVGYQQHREALLHDFARSMDEYVVPSFDLNLDVIDQLIDQILRLLSTICRETRNLRVVYYRPRTLFYVSSMRMKLPVDDVDVDALDRKVVKTLEGQPIVWCSFVGALRSEEGAPPLYRPMIWLSDDITGALNDLFN
ncbi:hypothetical protein BZA70DRAFT_284776 [Myxozyma melibiosi]|uniref:Uncharacterized protein n=1 Tax=Myxozyma melibiosi TaxID=54550 RepID=A0ABR1F0X2_9ASCO